MCRGTQCPRAGEGCGPGALVCLENFFLCKFSFGGDKFHHTPGLAQTEVLQTLLGAAGTWSLGECRCPSPLRHREAPALSTTWGGGCAGELWLGENRLREQLSCRSRGALGKHLKHKPSSSSFSRKTPNQRDFCCKKQLQIHTLSNSWWLPASLWKHVLIQKNNSKISVQKPGPAPPNRHLYHITPAATQTRREALGLYPLPASTCATHGAKTTPDGRHKKRSWLLPLQQTSKPERSGASSTCSGTSFLYRHCNVTGKRFDSNPTEITGLYISHTYSRLEQELLFSDTHIAAFKVSQQERYAYI